MEEEANGLTVGAMGFVGVEDEVDGDKVRNGGVGVS